jgi:hypothetical protein
MFRITEFFLIFHYQEDELDLEPLAGDQHDVVCLQLQARLRLAKTSKLFFEQLSERRNRQVSDRGRNFVRPFDHRSSSYRCRHTSNISHELSPVNHI